jgi:hypothetical protein
VVPPQFAITALGDSLDRLITGANRRDFAIGEGSLAPTLRSVFTEPEVALPPPATRFDSWETRYSSPSPLFTGEDSRRIANDEGSSNPTRRPMDLRDGEFGVVWSGPRLMCAEVVVRAGGRRRFSRSVIDAQTGAQAFPHRSIVDTVATGLTGDVARTRRCLTDLIEFIGEAAVGRGNIGDKFAADQCAIGFKLRWCALESGVGVRRQKNCDDQCRD